MKEQQFPPSSSLCFFLASFSTFLLLVKLKNVFVSCIIKCRLKYSFAAVEVTLV